VTRGLSIVCLGASLLALGCETSSGGDGASGLAQRLSDSVGFKLGRLVDGRLPDPTDNAVELIDLGPSILLAPGDSELLAFEETDPEAREVVATLLQFEGEDTHLRGEVEESGGSVSAVITNELEVEEGLCNGLCDGVLSIGAHVALELADGAITKAVALEIAIDCRGVGTEGECPVAPGTDPSAPGLICDDVRKGEAALTSDAQLDAYFDAVRTLALYSIQTNESAEDALTEIRTALGSDADSDGIPTALESRIADATEAGLLVLVGDPGCAVRAPRVQHTLRVCDRELDAEMASMACSGLCEPGIDRNACVEATGTCIGACQVVLDEPRACLGTCIGTCDGTCNGEEGGDCNGPCTGMCDGECREPIGEDETVCHGLCTGFCDASTVATADDPLPACEMPLNAYCGSPEDASLVCRGDCFGEASVGAGAPICQASALAIGELSARCDAPIVQIYFAYNAEADAGTQEDFAALVGEVNDPVTTLLVLLDRIDLLEKAASGLLAVADGPVADRLASQIEGIQAETTIDRSTPWLQDQVDSLQALRDDILAIAAVLDTTGL